MECRWVGISVPIGLCLFLMMYPAVLNLKASELRKIRRSPKPIVITLFANWLVAPLVGFLLGKLFLARHDELFVAVILLSASPCTAMVLVWGAMAPWRRATKSKTSSTPVSTRC